MSRSFRTGIDVNNQPITGVASPTNPTDAANKTYVDNTLAGLAWKQPVRVASTANVTLSTGVANGSTIDGVALTTGMRVLLKDQTAGAENGIYVVNASGAPTRAGDADTSAELQNATVFVTAGSVNADRGYTQTANDPTVGTTALAFAQVGGGTAYSAGAGLGLSGTTFSVVAGSGIIADGSSTRIDPAYAGLAKRYATTLSAGQSDVVHGLGTQDVTVTVYDVTGSTPVVVETDVTVKNATTVTIGLSTAAVANQYRVVVVA